MSKNEKKRTYGEYNNVKLSDTEMNKLHDFFLNVDDLIANLSFLKKQNHKTYKRDYQAILIIGHDNGLPNEGKRKED